MAMMVLEMNAEASASAKAAIICDECRKHADIGSVAGAACDKLPPVSKRPSSINVEKNGGHFDCNICMDGCHDPVVTLCGHLFCWPCLYCWLSLHSVSKECPICKANVQDKIIPLYGRGKAEHSMNSAAMMFPDMSIPCRPSPHRSDAPSGATNTVMDHDGEHNQAIQELEIRTSRAQTRNGASILARRRRFTNEKEFLLHWAFICVGSIAIVCFIVF